MFAQRKWTKQVDTALPVDCGGDPGGNRGIVIGCIEAAMLAPVARLVLGAAHG